jgi:hypothetical protein
MVKINVIGLATLRADAEIATLRLEVTKTGGNNPGKQAIHNEVVNACNSLMEELVKLQKTKEIALIRLTMSRISTYTTSGRSPTKAEHRATTGIVAVFKDFAMVSNEVMACLIPP